MVGSHIILMTLLILIYIYYVKSRAIYGEIKSTNGKSTVYADIRTIDHTTGVLSSRLVRKVTFN